MGNDNKWITFPGTGCYFITREGEVVGGPGLNHAEVVTQEALAGRQGLATAAVAQGHTRISVARPHQTAEAGYRRGARLHPLIEVAIEAPSWDALEWAVYVVQRDLPQASIYYDIKQGGKAVKSATIYPGDQL